MQWIKLAGLLLTGICIGGLGFYSAGQLWRRAVFLEELARFLERLGVDLSTRLEAPGDALGRLLQRETGERLSFLQKCAQDCRAGVPFPQAWEKALQEPIPTLVPEEREWLRSLGDILGQAALPMQMAVLDQVCMQMRTAAGSARQQAAVQGPVRRTVGVLAGALVCIVLL